RPQHAENFGHHFWTLDSGRAGFRASRKDRLAKIAGQSREPREWPRKYKPFNAKTNKEPEGMISPVLVTVYSDRSFTFITKTPPASELLKRAAGIVKGSAEPNRTKVGKVTKKQGEDIAKTKLPDLNTT